MNPENPQCPNPEEIIEFEDDDLQFLASRQRIKKLLLIITCVLILLLIGVFCLLRNPMAGTGRAPTKDEISIDETKLHQHVKALTSTDGHRHSENAKALEQAAAYITKQWESMGYSPKEQPFKTGNGKSYKNVIASVGPKAGPRIIVGAHYDVCGEQVGADDNASGVAGLLEMGRALKKLESKLPIRIDLVAYTLEEPPYFRTSSMGSAVHAQAMVDQKVDVKLMISLEMIGFFSDKPHSQRYPSALLGMLYPSVGDFVAVVGNWTVQGLEAVRKIKRHMAPASAVPVYSMNGPSSIPGLDFSDHLNYWARGIPALMVTDTAFFRNPHYHKKTDTITTLDFVKMAQVVRGITWAVAQYR